MAYTTIDLPTDYFNTVLYTGNGTTDHAITGVGFQPDFFWGKKRSASGSHFLVNSISGVGKHLHSDATLAETTFAEGVKSFDSDGVTIGTAGDINDNSQTFVSWNWLAGGTASSNTDGSITSTVSANTTSGFSIVKYTGTGSDITVGHGLNAVPKMIIVKALDTGTDPWWTYHASLGNSAKLRLNQTQASQTTSDYIWNQTDPTSSVFSLDSANNGSNASGNDFIAYCFAEKKGYSKFGSYTGNGQESGKGPFIYLGFKPAFFLLKESSNADNWIILDNKRQGYNGRNDMLFPNLSNAEYASDRIELMSNGVKIIDSDGSINTSGATYIYMAFAEAPFVTSTGIPTTAR